MQCMLHGSCSPDQGAQHEDITGTSCLLTPVPARHITPLGQHIRTKKSTAQMISMPHQSCFNN